MIPELGLYALILTLCLALSQVTCRFLKAEAPSRLPAALAVAQFFTLSIAFACLISGFVDSDFSVATVADNSHHTTPLMYKITASWGNHEGSMLLWAWVLGLFGALLALSSQNHPFRQDALAVQSGLSVLILLFILLTSNPFLRLLPPAFEGAELNPILQDIGLAIHPPMLYLGYVGFSLVFSLTVAGLWRGTIGRDWATAAHPWILLAWSFLTFGIGLGSWWAYRELGWGSWWFWDPVENASLMPWLAGTALLHSNLVLKKRGQMPRWTAFLAILAFSLSLLGTFLVRSGALTSVHSFANDPLRGFFILAILALTSGGALVLFGLRAPALAAPRADSLLSREGAMLLNNLFTLTGCFTVLLATLYPLIIELLYNTKLSIGPPYFNATFLPLMAPVALLAGLAAHIPWQRGEWRLLFKRVRLSAVITLAVIALSLWLAPERKFIAASGFGLATWLIATTLESLGHQPQWRRMPASQWGMLAAHSGLALLFAAITYGAVASKEDQHNVLPGAKVSFGQYRIEYVSRQETPVENYRRTAHRLRLFDHNTEIGIYEPQTRFYPARKMQTTEVAIVPFFLHDLYLAASVSPDSGKTALRLYDNAGISGIWIACLLMAGGGLLSRHRLRRSSLDNR